MPNEIRLVYAETAQKLKREAIRQQHQNVKATKDRGETIEYVLRKLDLWEDEGK